MQKLSAKGVNRIKVLTMGGKQLKIYIDEKNLYRLMGRSDKPQAIKFMDWVDFEVLPSIRKTGSYWFWRPQGPGRCQPAGFWLHS